jgi:hypothetical protein
MKRGMSMRRVGAVIALGVLGVLGFAIAPGGLATILTTTEPGPNDHRVTICHKVEGLGNTGNGYNIITVDKDSISTLPNGHDTHEGDIIPAFAAGFVVGPPPKQWNAYPGKGNASLIGTGCVAQPRPIPLTRRTLRRRLTLSRRRASGVRQDRVHSRARTVSRGIRNAVRMLTTISSATSLRRRRLLPRRKSLCPLRRQNLLSRQPSRRWRGPLPHLR